MKIEDTPEGEPKRNSKDAAENAAALLNPLGWEAAFGQNNLLFRCLFEQAAVGIAFLDSTYHLVRVNQKFCTLLGYSEAQLQSISCQAIAHPDDFEICFAKVQSLAMGLQSSFSLENRYIRKDGSVVWANTTVSPIHDASGQLILYSLIVQDISERKRTEAVLHQQEIELQALFSAMTELVLVVDADGRYLKIAPAKPGLLYRSASELLGKTIHEVLPAIVADSSMKAIRQALQSHQTVHYEYSLEIQGRETWFSANVSPLSETSVVVVARDITEQKQLHLALQASEARLSSILNRTHASISCLRCYPDQDYQYEYLSSGCEQVFGFTTAELSANKSLWRSRILPQDLAHLELPGQITQAQTVTTEYRFRHKDGQIRWIANLVQTEWDAADQTWILTAIDIDITDRKRIESALRSSQKRLAFLLKSSPAVIYTTLPGEGYPITFVSDNVAALTGFTAEDLYHNPRQWKQQIHPEDIAKIQQAGVILPIRGSICFEYRFLHRDGHYCWIQDEAVLIRDEADNPIEIIGYCIDVTTRKSAELALQQLNLDLERRIQARTAALQDSEEKFRQLAENVGKVFWIKDRQGRLLYISPSYEEIWQRPVEQLYQNSQDWLVALHPEDRTRAGLTSKIFQHQQPEELEYRLLRPNGDVRWIRDRAFPVRNEQGEFYRIAGIAEDITERKRTEAEHRQAELEIRRSRDLFEAVFQESTDAIFLVDSITWLNVDCNQGAVQLFEATSKEELLQIRGCTLHKHPLSAADLAIAQQAFQNGEIWSQEIEYRTLKGNSFWGNVATKRIQVAEQEMTLVRVTDVNDRKQADQILRQQASGESLLKQVAFQTRSSLNLDDILNASIDRVQDFLQADRVLIYRFESDVEGTIVVESVSQPEFSILGRHLEDPCFTRAVAERYQQGHSHTISDIQAEDIPICYVEFLSQLQVRAVLVVPVLQNNQLWGLLIAHHCTAPRQWQLFELDLLKQFADLISIAIHQTDLYAQIESQLKQKEILLKEVHHRVKNNLQVISAMLRLQARTTNDPVILDALEDSRSRLRAIALIHEILYQDNNLERLEFHYYIQNLTNTILATYSSSNRIRPIYQLQPIQLNLETAIPCGLLLNELVTNAIKHAFPQEHEGEIRISLDVEAVSSWREPNILPVETTGQPVPPIEVPGVKNFFEQPERRYILTVEDAGVGMPADFDIQQLRSLGLKIAYDLAAQLQGTLQFDRTEGTRFKLIFSELKYHKRL